MAQMPAGQDSQDINILDIVLFTVRHWKRIALGLLGGVILAAVFGIPKWNAPRMEIFKVVSIWGLTDKSSALASYLASPAYLETLAGKSETYDRFFETEDQRPKTEEDRQDFAATLASLIKITVTGQELRVAISDTDLHRAKTLLESLNRHIQRTLEPTNINAWAEAGLSTNVSLEFFSSLIYNPDFLKTIVNKINLKDSYQLERQEDADQILKQRIQVTERDFGITLRILDSKAEHAKFILDNIIELLASYDLSKMASKVAYGVGLDLQGYVDILDLQNRLRSATFLEQVVALAKGKSSLSTDEKIAQAKALKHRLNIQQIKGGQIRLQVFGKDISEAEQILAAIFQLLQSSPNYNILLNGLADPSFFQEVLHSKDFHQKLVLRSDVSESLESIYGVTTLSQKIAVLGQSYISNIDKGQIRIAPSVNTPSLWAPKLMLVLAETLSNKSFLQLAAENLDRPYRGIVRAIIPVRFGDHGGSDTAELESIKAMTNSFYWKHLINSLCRQKNQICTPHIYSQSEGKNRVAVFLRSSDRHSTEAMVQFTQDSLQAQIGYQRSPTKGITVHATTGLARDILNGVSVTAAAAIIDNGRHLPAGFPSNSMKIRKASSRIILRGNSFVESLILAQSLRDHLAEKHNISISSFGISYADLINAAQETPNPITVFSEHSGLLAGIDVLSPTVQTGDANTTPLTIFQRPQPIIERPERLEIAQVRSATSTLVPMPSYQLMVPPHLAKIDYRDEAATAQRFAIVFPILGIMGGLLLAMGQELKMKYREKLRQDLERAHSTSQAKIA